MSPASLAVLTTLPTASVTFQDHATVAAAHEAACADAPHARFAALGWSEAGRRLYGVVLGTGPRTVSLVAGAHADEPVGPETLRLFITEALRRPEAFAPLLNAFQFVVVPHVNPDGEAANRGWMDAWPSPQAYLRHRVRELPGRDIEFGYPALRAENTAVATFLADHAPMVLHMSLHGMGIAEGALLLIERHWSFRTNALREGYAAAVQAAGIPLHDQNRRGEKGFFYLGPGFWTTPEGEAMRTFFHAQHDPDTAALFHDSSMEYVRALGGDPLCLVTELPLFTLRPDADAPDASATAYRRFRAQRHALTEKAQAGEDLQEVLDAYGLQAMHRPTLVQLQLKTLTLGLQAVLACEDPAKL